MAGLKRRRPSAPRQSVQQRSYPEVSLSFSLPSLSKWIFLTWLATLEGTATATAFQPGLVHRAHVSAGRDNPHSSWNQQPATTKQTQRRDYWRRSASSSIPSSNSGSSNGGSMKNPLQMALPDHHGRTKPDAAPQQSSPQPSSSNRNQGLSRYHQSILSRMASSRQRFVTGQYPIIATVKENPTMKWLAAAGSSNTATAQLWVNGTTVDRSLASYDRFQWLDERERSELHDKYRLVSMELLAVIQLTKPGYVNVLPGHGAGSTAAASRYLESSSTTKPWDRWKVSAASSGSVLEELEERVDRERLWVTGFSMTTRGCLHSVDTDTGHIASVNARTSRALLWPNEVSAVPSKWFTTTTMPPPISAEKTSSRLLLDDNNDANSNAVNGAATTAHASTTSEPRTTKLLKVQSQQYEWKDAVLVCDGFLVPGKDRGGVYVVTKPGNPNNEWTVCLTQPIGYDRWFYHRAVFADLTGDGRLSILTARAKFPLGKKNGATSSISKQSPVWPDDDVSSSVAPKKATCGQLVCLEMPKPHSYDEATGTPLEADGTVFDPLSAHHLPWKEHVLAEGPDVMFNVADFDPEDDTVEVIASQFFGEKVTLHSIQRGPTPKVTFQRTIDDKCGKAFGSILADLEEGKRGALPDRIVMDAGCTVETLKPGDFFSHILVTSHECSFVEEGEKPKTGIMAPFQQNNLQEEDDVLKTLPKKKATVIDGGSLFAYRVPEGKGKWKTEPWVRTTVASGFKVQGQLSNMINPGAPGFVYTFHARLEDKLAENKRRPLIAVAGDCADSAYLFRPSEMPTEDDGNDSDLSAQYDLMCEIKCGATVGSIGVGYGDFCSEMAGAEQESGYAKIFIPCYEKDKVLVFALGSGED